MVDAVERPRDQTTGMAKGFAFITFKDPAVVETIVGQRWLTLPNGARIECKDWLFTFMVRVFTSSRQKIQRRVEILFWVQKFWTKIVRAWERNNINTKENQRIKINMLIRVDQFIWITMVWPMLGMIGKTLIGPKLLNVST